MSEYHKIETLYERDEATHRLKMPLVLKNRIYGCVDPWVFTEKIDGTNIRCIWSGGRVTFGGRTDAANIPAELVNWLQANVTEEKMRAAFQDLEVGSVVVLYGEGYGAGIQKGGGDYSPEKKLILFDVLVRSTSIIAMPQVESVGFSAPAATLPSTKQSSVQPGSPQPKYTCHDWWLSDENMRDVAAKLGLDAVPLVGEMSLARATEFVREGFRSRLNGGKKEAEGLVGRPVEALFDKKGHRLIVKLKTKDFPQEPP